MYIRRTTVVKGEKTHVYWRLVRSVRCGRKVRQEVVANLGELDEEGRLAARALADRLAGVERTPGLFDDELPAEPVALDLRSLRLERGRSFGDVWIAWRVWRALGFDALLERLLPPGRESVPWAATAAVLAIARLCKPSSELDVAEDWFRSTALDDLLGVPVAAVNDDRCYRGLDRLLACKEQLETHVKDRLGTLFSLDYDLLLYDVTSTYFEGKAEGNDLAARGHSRDHRPDCKQVCIGLVVTREGYPLGFEVFAGNRNDSTTLEEVVDRMESRYGKASRVWALDRGMVSEKHLAWLRKRGSRYVVGTPKSQLTKFPQRMLSQDWEQVREGLAVKKTKPDAADPGGGGEAETYVLCRSDDRKAKEQAIREKAAERLERDLRSLQEACGKRRLSIGVVERRVGRRLQDRQRAARFYDVKVTETAAGARLEWSRNEKAWASASSTDGCYLLRSNVSEWTAEELWRSYIQLTEAESAFRIQKDELRLRPVWHQKAERVVAHILVCFLAYVMRKTLEGWCKAAGLGSSAPKVLEELGRIQSTDVVLPTCDGRELRLRCVVRPDRDQQMLLDRLGLELPQRLRLPRGLESATA